MNLLTGYLGQSHGGGRLWYTLDMMDSTLHQIRTRAIGIRENLAATDLQLINAAVKFLSTN